MLVWHAITIILACAIGLTVSVEAAFADMMITTGVGAFSAFMSFLGIMFLALFGAFNRMSRNALATRLIKTMPGKCIACNKPILPSEDHSDYHIVNYYWTSHIGTLSVHHRPECTNVGIEFLEKHSKKLDKGSMIAVHRIGDRTYSYDFLVDKKGFWFIVKTPEYDKWHDATIAFLRTYRRSPDVVLAVRLGADESYRIPILVSTKNQHIDQAAIAGKARQKAMLEAETMADRGMTVVGGNLDQETTVLAQYARATFIEFNAGSPVVA